MPKRFRTPKIVIETIEDAYTYYVLIVGMSEDMFWDAPIAFLETVFANKAAYDGWTQSTQYQLQQKQLKQSKRR